MQTGLNLSAESFIFSTLLLIEPPHPVHLSLHLLLLLPPRLAPLLTIKQAADLSWHNCHYDRCSPAHTVFWLFYRGGGKHCLLCADATQYYHSVTTTHPHTHIHTHTPPASQALKPVQSPCNLSIKHKTNISFYWAKKIHTPLPLYMFKKNCQALGKHTHSATANRKW